MPITKYIAMPVTAEWWDARGSDYLAKTVIEQEKTPRDTKLLDQYGNKLVAIEEQKIGFI